METLFNAAPGYKMVEKNGMTYHVPADIPDENAPAVCERMIKALNKKQRRAARRDMWGMVHRLTAQLALVAIGIVAMILVGIASGMLTISKYVISGSLLYLLFH